MQEGSDRLHSDSLDSQVTFENQLIQASKMSSIGEMAAGVAHEINNPIAVILGFTELLLEKFSGDSKERTILKAIERQGDNCKRIVENLLDLLIDGSVHEESQNHRRRPVDRHRH